MSEPASKRARTSPTYELLYHPGIPGRAEHIRLLLEASSTPYTDVSNESKSGYGTVQKICMNGELESADGNPPVFSPPALRVVGEGKDGASLVMSQTPNILAYLGERTGMDGGADAKWHVAQLALTALDLNNEVHDTHHPVAVMKYYEEQKDEALLKAQDVRENRFPKYFSYFQRTLRANKERGGGEGRYLVGSRLTYADTTIWQVLDGLFFAFPKEMEVRKGEFEELLGVFYEGVKEEKGIKEYLASERRLKYSMGIFRHYPELDRQ